MRVDSISNKSSKSPSFSLFPSTPPPSAHNSANKLLPKPSPLSRSVTAPSHQVLPPRPTIEKSKSHDQDHVLVIVHNSHDIPGTPTLHSRQADSDSSQRSADSTTAGFTEAAEDYEYSYPIIDNSPARTMKSPPQRAFPARKSSMKKRDSPQQPCRQERNSPIDPAAEVSVARQISISRRQRQLLVPIVPKTARQPMQPRINEQNTTEESRKSHHLTLEDA